MCVYQFAVIFRIVYKKDKFANINIIKEMNHCPNCNACGGKKHEYETLDSDDISIVNNRIVQFKNSEQYIYYTSLLDRKERLMDEASRRRRTASSPSLDITPQKKTALTETEKNKRLLDSYRRRLEYKSVL